MNGIDYPQISPIIFNFGPFALRWYSLAYLFGIIAAWFLILRNIKKYDISLTKIQVEDLVFYVTLGIIIGGRLGYAVFYGGSLMWSNPLRLLEIWKGGMSFHGGVAGVIAAVYYYSRRIKYPFLKLTDLVVLYTPIGIFCGRLANFVNDELWGRVTDVCWAVRFPNGGYLPRHPSQIYEALLEGVLMFVVLNFMWRFKTVRIHVGTVSAMFVLLYGLFRMFLEQYREPDVQLGFIIGQITMGQLLSFPLVIIGVVFLLWRFKPEK